MSRNRGGASRAPDLPLPAAILERPARSVQHHRTYKARRRGGSTSGAAGAPAAAAPRRTMRLLGSLLLARCASAAEPPYDDPFRCACTCCSGGPGCKQKLQYPFVPVIDCDSECNAAACHQAHAVACPAEAQGGVVTPQCIRRNHAPPDPPGNMPPWPPYPPPSPPLPPPPPPPSPHPHPPPWPPGSPPPPPLPPTPPPPDCDGDNRMSCYIVEFSLIALGVTLIVATSACLACSYSSHHDMDLSDRYCFCFPGIGRNPVSGGLHQPLRPAAEPEPPPQRPGRPPVQPLSKRVSSAVDGMRAAATRPPGPRVVGKQPEDASGGPVSHHSAPGSLPVPTSDGGGKASATSPASVIRPLGV